MARARDLELALAVLAARARGRPAWRVELPAPRRQRLPIRVAVWLDEPAGPPRRPSYAPLEGAAPHRRRGARVDRTLRPVDAAASHRVYLRLLAVIAAGFPRS
jgi:hypothetical protein